jgi:hypothetical protein
MSPRFSWAPTAPKGGGQFKTVHGVGHMDVRENNRDIEAAFKYFDGLVSVIRLGDLETAGPDHINRIHADEEIVPDNQDHNLMVRLGIRRRKFSSSYIQTLQMSLAPHCPAQLRNKSCLGRLEPSILNMSRTSSLNNTAAASMSKPSPHRIQYRIAARLK